MLQHIERLKAWQAFDLPPGIERTVRQNRLQFQATDRAIIAKMRLLGRAGRDQAVGPADYRWLGPPTAAHIHMNG